MLESNEIIELETFITIKHQHSHKPKPQSTILYSRNCYNKYITIVTQRIESTEY